MAGCSIDANFQQSSSEILPDIGENPNHPIKYNFPKRAFGVKDITHRSFQAQWFQKWSWIHYDEGRDIVFCSICVKAARSNKLKAAKICDLSFISRGTAIGRMPCTGKKGGFCRHEASGCHKAAVEAVVTLPKTTGDIGELLSSAHAKEKASNQKNLMTVARCLRFMARQGLTIRGDGDEMDSNFHQLLILKGEAKYFTIMADEVTDASNVEQVVVILSAFPTTANVGVRDIVQHVCTLSPGVRLSITQVCSLVRLLLVMPATNAVGERSASALRRVKSYLRTTMTDTRLNNLLVLHVHKDRCDSLVLEDCLNEFVCGSEHRLSLFGKF
ncbi:hypothetical protein EMCRGX_G030291 [Ephydatia muelleri]|eukprot:Em0010g498a